MWYLVIDNNLSRQIAFIIHPFGAWFPYCYSPFEEWLVAVLNQGLNLDTNQLTRISVGAKYVRFRMPREISSILRIAISITSPGRWAPSCTSCISGRKYSSSIVSFRRPNKSRFLQEILQLAWWGNLVTSQVVHNRILLWTLIEQSFMEDRIRAFWSG